MARCRHADNVTVEENENVMNAYPIKIGKETDEEQVETDENQDATVNIVSPQKEQVDDENRNNNINYEDEDDDCDDDDCYDGMME